MHGRDLAIAISLANLCLIRVWLELLFLPENARYYLVVPPQAKDYLAAPIIVALLAALFLGVLNITRKSSSPWPLRFARVGFLLALLLPLNILRRELLPPSRVDGILELMKQGGVDIVVGLAGAVFFVLALCFRRHLFRAVCGFVLALFPFAILLFAQAAVKVVRGSVPGEKKSLAKPLPIHDNRQVRMVWVLFDELDESMLFSKRPEGLKMPEFDRLRAEAIYATQAFPPARETLLSIPALLTGTLVSKAEVGGPSNLLITLGETGEKVSWGAQRTVFSRAREAGYNVSVVGWYHPYCRLFAQALTRCFWHPYFGTTIGQVEDKTFLESIWRQLLAIPPLASRRLAVEAYRSVLEEAKKAVSNKDPGLTYLHLPVPHPPGIYDRARGDFTTTALSDIEGYVDNLALTDRTLGELRRMMEAAGNWEGTVLLVTSDHVWSKARAFDGRVDPYVPYLLKLPGQTRSLPYEGGFNTVLASELVLAILQGKIKTPDAVVEWLEGHKTIGRSPYDSSP